MNPLRSVVMFVTLVLTALFSSAQSLAQSKDLLAPVTWLAGCWSADEEKSHSCKGPLAVQSKSHVHVCAALEEARPS